MGQTAEELLNSLTDEQIAAYTATPANEEHIVVGADRFITVPPALERIAVQFDHNIETVTFDCPRYWDGHDMSKMAIYINYMRPDNARGSYPVTNVRVDETDDSIMHFDWTISENVTLVKGKISFLVCVKKTDADGLKVNHWNSELNQDMEVSQGLECEESTIELYPDLITQLLLKMEELGKLLVISDDGEGNVTIEGLNTTLNICDAFDIAKTYSVGDYVLQYGMMYKCVLPVTEPGMWKLENWEICNVMDEVKSCFQSVSDGKALIASAIIDMGVQTEATDTFEQMATNIRSITTGVVPEGTAQPEDVTLGKTFKNESGQLLTGTSTAAADLADLQDEYDTLSDAKDELQRQYDSLVGDKNTVQAAYDEYKNAVVNGLQHSGLGVTLETTAAELEAILLAKFPPYTAYSVDFANYPISEADCTTSGDVGYVRCDNDGHFELYITGGDGSGAGGAEVTINLPTQGCNKVDISYYQKGVSYINSTQTVGTGDVNKMTLSCSGDTFALKMSAEVNGTGVEGQVLIVGIRFYHD